MAPEKHIVFDIEGTLVSHDRVIQAIDECLGDRLRAQGIKPKLLGHMWFEAAEREYTYLFMSGLYVPFIQVFPKIFYRMLWLAGIEEPRGFATEENVRFIMSEYTKLEMRLGAAECVSKLRDAGFTVWALTAGDRLQVKGYFDKAGISMPAENVLGCDTDAVAKPSPEAYLPLLAKLGRENRPWFAAAHMWDVSAARRTGFRGAYCTVFEKEPLLDLFGDMDVVAPTLPDMADRVIAAS